MIHHRHIIREAICAALAAGGTAAAGRVFDEPHDVRTVFPSLSVWDVAEDQRAESMMVESLADRIIGRQLTIEVRAEVAQVATAGRTRDQLLADVERILSTVPIDGVKSITPAGYAPQRDNTAELPLLVGRQRFEITYYTSQGDPSAPV